LRRGKGKVERCKVKGKRRKFNEVLFLVNGNDTKNLAELIPMSRVISGEDRTIES
jgi:hypothetical protein